MKEDGNPELKNRPYITQADGKSCSHINISFNTGSCDSAFITSDSEENTTTHDNFVCDLEQKVQ